MTDSNSYDSVLSDFPFRFRSRDDFAQDDLRLMLPRWSEENFAKNLVVVDRIKEIADRVNATPSQVCLAWILAEHPDCECDYPTTSKNINNDFLDLVIPIPGSRTIERIEENAKGAEITLSAEDVKAIRQLTEEAEVAGQRYDSWMVPEGTTLPLSEWTGHRQW